MVQELLDIISQRLSAHFSDAAHDIYHLQRVMRIAGKIQEQEGGNRDVVLLAALVHDVHRIIEKRTGKPCHPKDSLSEVKVLLADLAIDKQTLQQVLHCVDYHDDFPFDVHARKVTDIETLIIQDADRIDAMGAIGILRCAMFGGDKGIPMYTDDPIDTHYDSSTYDPSVIHHFYHKLFKLRDNMNTQTGKHMAEERHAFMVAFVDEFLKEWKGV